MASELADKIAEKLGRGRKAPGTDRRHLPGGATGDFARYLEVQSPRLAQRFGLPQRQADDLVRSYGSRVPLLERLLQQNQELARPVSDGSSLLAGQVVFAARYELARTPEDVLRRRTSLALRQGRGLEELEAVAALLADTLGADVGRQRQWIDSYRQKYSQQFS